MAGMSETCTVCGRGFDVQFRYQMEERDNAFSFFCSQACHGKSLRGEADERRRLRLLQQALHRRARLAGRPHQGRGALRVLRGLPRAAPRGGGRAPPRAR